MCVFPLVLRLTHKCLLFPLRESTVEPPGTPPGDIPEKGAAGHPVEARPLSAGTGRAQVPQSCLETIDRGRCGPGPAAGGRAAGDCFGPGPAALCRGFSAGRYATVSGPKHGDVSSTPGARYRPGGEGSVRASAGPALLAKPTHRLLRRTTTHLCHPLGLKERGAGSDIHSSRRALE